MIRLTELRLPLDHEPAALRAAVLQHLGVADEALRDLHVFRRAYDARRKTAIVLIYTLDCTLTSAQDEAAVLARLRADTHVRPSPDTSYRLVAQAPADFRASQRPRPVVIGFGPCGLFAALILAQMGLCPIVLERGRPVRERTKDTWGLWRQGVLNPASNVQFGEGGAGTFSDGKLWSQISDPRHLTRKVLTEFVQAGAPEEILYVSKPHIGTFRLVSMIEKMRAGIEALGGEIRFEQQVTDLLLEPGGIGGFRHRAGQDAPRLAGPCSGDGGGDDDSGGGDDDSGGGSGPEGRGAGPHLTGDAGLCQLRGLRLASGEELRTDHVVLAVGHSARDTFAMLHGRGVAMQAKPFSVGFRIEHPQGMIDRARFGPNAGHPLLGAADYKLVHHAKNGRSVYSFCMCPGGTVVAATSEPGRVVTNGMSQYSRNERNA
ncbi:MAG: NAD(P)/FAD-dependent oxidoreductase, partial [Rubrivivax sp.]